MNEYRIKEQNQYKKIQSDLKNLGFDFAYSENEEGYPTLKMGVIVLRYNEYQKQYYIYSEQRYKYIDSHAMNEILKSIKQPNNIGVLSTKKVNDWLKYYSEVNKEADKKSTEKQQKVAELKKEVKLKLNADFRQSQNGTYEGLETSINGLILKITIEDNGYISKKIELDWRITNDIDTFIKLSNNKYEVKQND